MDTMMPRRVARDVLRLRQSLPYRGVINLLCRVRTPECRTAHTTRTCNALREASSSEEHTLASQQVRQGAERTSKLEQVLPPAIPRAPAAKSLLDAHATALHLTARPLMTLVHVLSRSG